MALQDILEANKEGLFYKKTKDYCGVDDYIASGLVVTEAFTKEKEGLVQLYSGPCHASMRHYPVENSFCYTAINKRFSKNKGAIKYYDWLVNTSAFRNAFVTKDPEDCAMNGTIINCNFQGDGFLSAAQLARFSTSEYKGHFEAMCAVLEDGYKIHPLLLTLVSITHKLILAVDKSYKAAAPYSFANNNGHMPFNSGIGSYVGIKAFCADEALEDKPAAALWRTRSWANSHNVLTAPARVKKASLYPNISSTPINNTTFVTKTVFKVGEEVEQLIQIPVEVLWSKAVNFFSNKFSAKTLAAAGGAGTYLNLSLLEQLTETLKLGEL